MRYKINSFVILSASGRQGRQPMRYIPGLYTGADAHSVTGCILKTHVILSVSEGSHKASRRVMGLPRRPTASSQ